ncbi:MAG: hypothetical protein V3U45_07340 [bacterium]
MSGNPRRWTATQIDALWTRDVEGNALGRREGRALRGDRVPGTPDPDEVLELAFREMLLLECRTAKSLLEPMAEACIRAMGWVRWEAFRRRLKIRKQEVDVDFRERRVEAIPPPEIRPLTFQDRNVLEALRLVQGEVGSRRVARTDLLDRLQGWKIARVAAGRLIQGLVDDGILGLYRGDCVGPGPGWMDAQGGLQVMFGRVTYVSDAD